MAKSTNILVNIVLPFVAKYDIPFRYDTAIGKLWQSGCFAGSQDWKNLSKQALAEFVGASYCCMIREDVYYRLPEGLTLARRSLAAAQELDLRLANSKRQSTSHLYAAVRWHDAFGRLLYRTGNYSLARLEFSKSLDLIGDRQRGYWYWPDIRSNLSRTNFEIARQISNEENRAWDYYRELIESADFAIARIKRERDPHFKSELRRGIVSSLHNSLECRKHLPVDILALEHKPDRPKLLRTVSETHRLISNYVKKDVYREAQFTNSRGISAATPQEKTREFNHLLGSNWPRGHFIARQNLAFLNQDFETLLLLCEEIERELLASGGIDLVDIDRFDWTLNLAEKVAKSKGKLHEDDRTRLARQQEVITEAVSTVISVAAYRERFENKIRKRLRKVAGERMKRIARRRNSKDAAQEFDGLVDKLETFGAKEVLEVLRVNRANKRTDHRSKNLDSFLVKAPKEPTGAKQNGKPTPESAPGASSADHEILPIDPASDEIELLPVAHHSPALAATLNELASEARAADELYWLNNPLSIRTPPDSPSQRARQVTISQPGQLFIRYGVHLDSRTEKEKLTAQWWYRGRAGYVMLTDGALALAKQFNDGSLEDERFFQVRVRRGSSLVDQSTGIPRLELSQQLWSAFLAPVFEKLNQEFPNLGNGKHPITDLTIFPESELYKLPINSAWVPKATRALPHDHVPLGQACNLSFSLNLTSHLLDGRINYANCIRHREDELTVLYHDRTKRFESKKHLHQVRNVATHWGERGEFSERANRGTVKKALSKRAEFLMFMCHGKCDDANGPMLILNGCHLISHNLSYSAALHGNKLLVLGACESANSNSDSYGKFIGAFIAAGAGAVLANPCQAIIPTVCRVAAEVVSQIKDSTQDPLNLAATLRESTQVAYDWLRALKTIPVYSDEELKLASSTYQLWL